MSYPSAIRNQITIIILLCFLLLLAGCSGFLPASGPPTTAYMTNSVSSPEYETIQVVDITDTVARKLLARKRYQLFSELLPEVRGFDTELKVGPGDILEVSVWEAPPASLFGVNSSDPRAISTSTRVSIIPSQMVSSKGTITVPFVGELKVAEKSLQQIELELVKALSGKANQPQLLVRFVTNRTSNVTLVGEMGNSILMPLTPKGERLLDALAAAGGVRQPVDKMTIQLTRGSSVYLLPMETIIKDPRQNILLKPGDVVTALFQSASFTALGATAKNGEINFEVQGISLAQALARSGGLVDTRADALGVFVFRFEDADALDWPSKPVAMTPDNRVPVVYRINLRDPTGFLVSQNFPIHNRDVLFVSNAPASELQKFLNLVASVLSPTLGVMTLSR